MSHGRTFRPRAIRRISLFFTPHRTWKRIMTVNSMVGLALVLVLLLGGTAGPEARAADDPADAEAVFEAIAQAWSEGDEDALAALVHSDGLRVTNGDYQRFTNYSPSQAYYYFKNQFRRHPTLSFEFKRLQNSGARLDSYEAMERIHGMVVWQFNRTGRPGVEERKLVLVLARQDDNWRLAEINTITTR